MNEILEPTLGSVKLIHENHELVLSFPTRLDPMMILFLGATFVSVAMALGRQFSIIARLQEGLTVRDKLGRPLTLAKQEKNLLIMIVVILLFSIIFSPAFPTNWRVVRINSDEMKISTNLLGMSLVAHEYKLSKITDLHILKYEITRKFTSFTRSAIAFNYEGYEVSFFDHSSTGSNDLNSNEAEKLITFLKSAYPDLAK